MFPPKIQDTIVDITRALENHELLTKVLGIDLIAARKQMASVENRNNQITYLEKHLTFSLTK